MNNNQNPTMFSVDCLRVLITDSYDWESIDSIF